MDDDDKYQTGLFQIATLISSLIGLILQVKNMNNGQNYI